MEYLFSEIGNMSDELEFQVKCSFLEIYLEKIHDLLDPRKNNLQVKVERGRGIWIQDATEVYVTNSEEMKCVHDAGHNNRAVAATRMNERSSRSHCLFIVTIFQKNIKTEETKLGRLYFVDLAGSEKVEKTQASGKVLDEAKMINLSLSALGNVINALTEPKKNGKEVHVPYRDSKLTRILQESLGGNALTCLVVTLSMSSYNDRETLSTCRFGARAKRIQNKPVANTAKSAKELLKLLNQAEENILKHKQVIRLLQTKVEQELADLDDKEKIEALRNEVKRMKQKKDINILLKLLSGEVEAEEGAKEAAPPLEQEEESPVHREE